MKIGIIGAGVTGLSAAYYLSKLGHEVVIFERGETAGGLAAGFKDSNWDWHLEHHYHHIFTTDSAIRRLATEIHHPPFFNSPQTSLWFNDEICRFDGPKEILRYKYLSWGSRFRLSLGALFLKLWPYWRLLEGISAKDWIIRIMGNQAWRVIWKPLFAGKFGSHLESISAVWFWARIHARSRRLGYFENGFQGFVDALVAQVTKQGVVIRYGVEVDSVHAIKAGKVEISWNETKESYDRVIVAAPGKVLLKMVHDLSQSYQEKILALKGIGAVTLVLALKKSLLADGTYWLNVNQEAPFLAVVEHTNMIDPIHYGGDRIVYVGNYLSPTHAYFGLNEEELLDIYLPSLQKINPGFAKEWVRKAWVFKAAFAQPLVPLHYSKQLPGMDTGVRHVYWAGMELVYPWDRGTNFAVEWGEKVAKQAVKR